MSDSASAQTDVLIVGNGIAGSVLSLLLSQKQISHVLLSPTDRRKDFALAETLPPSALPMLEKLRLLELFERNAIQKTYGYHSMWGGNRILDHHFFGHMPFKYGLKLNKQALLQCLRGQSSARVLPIGSANKVRGTLTVDATGRARAVLKRHKVPIARHDSLISFSCHVPRIEHPKLTHGVYVESFEHGWGMVSTLNDHQNVMTLFTHRENRIRRELNRYASWASLLSETTLLKDFLTPTQRRVIGGNANSSLAERCAGEDWLAVGDAAMAFDPLSSHGITNAIYTAAQAADAIEASLAGGTEAPLRAYSDSLISIGAAYLKAKHRLYSQEHRWSGTTFWSTAQARAMI